MKKIAVKGWIIIGITVSLFLVFLVGLSSYLSLNNLKDDQEWVRHTEAVINTSQNVMKTLTDVESSQRGYVITGKEEFLQLYKDSLPELNLIINNLAKLILNNPDQVKRVNRLKVKVGQRLQIIAQAIINRGKANYKLDEDEIKLLSTGKKKMDEVRNLINVIVKTENDLLVLRKANSEQSTTRTILIIIFGTLLIFIIIIVLFRFIQSSFASQVKAKNQLNNSNKDLQDLILQNEERTWLISGYTIIDDAMREVQQVDVRANKILNEIAEYVGAKMGVIYLVDEENPEMLNKYGSYAYSETGNHKISFNEGLIGQVAKEKKRKTWDNVPDDYVKIKSGLGSTIPKHLVIEPIFFQSELKAVLELAFTEPISQKVLSLLDNSNSIIGNGLNVAQVRIKMQALFEETQLQAEELETQQEELRLTNDELFSKTQMLQSSEEELRVQQEELREINFELEEKAKLLEDKNLVIEEAREAIVVKMQQLEQSGKYKSEFLANMSHELRTPLNSILILARILRDNKLNHLSEEEAKYANVIFKAGNDLLTLINDILDLAKIESGKVELNYEETKVAEISEDIEQLFAEVAKNKEVNFTLSIDPLLPEKISTDKIRLEQIIKNLLSNAFKFTPKDGEVKVAFKLADKRNLKIDVSDTGIGIKPEKQKLIFEAFQQADGSTSREYGGTGLGLSICKELAHRMDGEINLESEPNKGSVFSLTIPLVSEIVVDAETEVKKEEEITEIPKANLNKIDNKAKRTKPILLVVEDDPYFNDFLKDYGEEKGFEVVQVFDGEQAISQAIAVMPDAILLDIMLPGIDGWKVLKRLKSEIDTSNIPIHMMSAGDQRGQKAIKSGALSFIKKPVDISMLDNVFSSIMQAGEVDYKNILLVEDHEVQSDALASLFRAKNIDVKQAYTGEEAMQLLDSQPFDCIILDLNLPDISGLDLLEKIKENEKFKDLPVVINTAMELDQEKMSRLLKYSNAMVMKSTKSSDRLIDEVNLFLHKIKSDDIKPNLNSIKDLTDLKGKTILVVDDDMRNIFAISAILDSYGFKVEIANDGIEALEKLDTIKNISMVLMDIMMPRMDGFEAMREVRKQAKFEKLPIIALTAKAMKEDRANCITAGANDYVTKPLDVDQLLSLVKVWMA
ncbi:MAG: response regulator [Pelobium sp.]